MYETTSASPEVVRVQTQYSEMVLNPQAEAVMILVKTPVVHWLAVGVTPETNPVIQVAL